MRILQLSDAHLESCLLYTSPGEDPRAAPAERRRGAALRSFWCGARFDRGLGVPRNPPCAPVSGGAERETESSVCVPGRTGTVNGQERGEPDELFL